MQAEVRSFHFIVITNGSHWKGKETILCALLQASDSTDGRVEGQEQHEVRKLWQDPAERSHWEVTVAWTSATAMEKEKVEKLKIYVGG